MAAAIQNHGPLYQQLQDFIDEQKIELLNIATQIRTIEQEERSENNILVLAIHRHTYELIKEEIEKTELIRAAIFT